MDPGNTSLLLQRVDPGRNMARYYGLTIEPTLFGGFAVRRTWGRLGTWGRSRLDYFPDFETAQAGQEKLAALKLKRGYSLNERDPLLPASSSTSEGI